jgi:hypothetical protein
VSRQPLPVALSDRSASALHDVGPLSNIRGTASTDLLKNPFPFGALSRAGRLRYAPLGGFAMNDENDPEIEYSPLCEEVTRDGLTVRVQIYRLKTGNDGWSLEVVDHEDASTVWDDLLRPIMRL